MYNLSRSGFFVAVYFLLLIFVGLLFIRYLGRDYYSAGAILLSAILALSGASMNVFYQRRTARESNSLSFQQSLSDNENYIKNIAVIVEAIRNRSETPLQEYAKSIKTDSKEAKAIRYVLNTWERAANAMRHRIYDEQYLYEAHKSMVLYFGVYLRAFIKEKQKRRC